MKSPVAILIFLFTLLAPVSLHARKDFYYIRPFTCEKGPEIRISPEDFTRLLFHEVLSDSSPAATITASPPAVREPWSIVVSGSYRYRGEKLSLEFQVVNHGGKLIYHQSIPGVTFERCREFVIGELRSLFFDLRIESLPPGADAIIENLPAGRTPLTGIRLPRGTYALRLLHEKCKDTTRSIDIPREREIRILLKPAGNGPE